MFSRLLISLAVFFLIAGGLAAAETGQPGPTPGNPEDRVGALTVFADGDETMGAIPLGVQLDVEVLPGTGVPPYRYHWDFGDGTTFSDQQNPSHVYRVPGSFRASVIVIDGREEVDQDYVDVTVYEVVGEGDVTARELQAWVSSQGKTGGVAPFVVRPSPGADSGASQGATIPERSASGK